MSVAAMALSAGAAYFITPDGGFQRAAHAGRPLDPLAFIEPDAGWFRPRAAAPDLAAGAIPTAAPTVVVAVVPASEPVAVAAPRRPASSKLSFEAGAPTPRVPKAPPKAPSWAKRQNAVSAPPPPPPQPQAAFPQRMAFPQQAALPAPTSTARPASTSFR